VLTGSEIIKQVLCGRIRISPFDINRIGPNSYDLTLSQKLIVYDEDVLDPRNENLKTNEIIIPDSGFVLCPNILYLGSSVESTGSSHYVPMLHGRSSAARLGICAHIAAGLGDIGWYGQWTLEIIVPHKVRIYPGMRICQVTFEEITGLVQNRYQGKYQDQKDPTPSKIWMDKLRKSQYSYPMLLDEEIYVSLRDLCSQGTSKISYLPWDKRYCVSDMGDVISLISKPKVLKTFTRDNDYKLVQIVDNKIYVHRLVAAAFLGGPYFDSQMHIVRHLDGNPRNNSLSNLCYGTEKENSDDSKRHGSTLVGSENHQSKLNEEKVIKIRKIRHESKATLHDLAVEFNVSEESIRRVLQRKTWGHLDDGLGNLCRMGYKPYQLSDEEKSDIMQRLLNGEPRSVIAAEYGVPKRVIHHLATKI